jgi:hypothetical protein
MVYKVIETSIVTDEEIERILNEWTGKGYAFESIQFVCSVSSRRPAMAFLFFTNFPCKAPGLNHGNESGN